MHPTEMARELRRKAAQFLKAASIIDAETSEKDAAAVVENATRRFTATHRDSDNSAAARPPRKRKQRRNVAETYDLIRRALTDARHGLLARELAERLKYHDSGTYLRKILPAVARREPNGKWVAKPASLRVNGSGNGHRAAVAKKPKRRRQSVTLNPEVRRQDIAAQLKAHGPMRAQAIADALGVHYTTAYKYLPAVAKHIKDGEGAGMWTLKD